MTDIDPTARDARESARRASGQFGNQERTAPDVELNPRVELDATNTLYQDNSQRMMEQIERYLQHGMPEGANRVVFEPSDQGDYLTVASAFDEVGAEIDTEDDYDRWLEVDDVIGLLGHPDDNSSIRDLLSHDGRGKYTWTRTHETDPAEAVRIQARIEELADTRDKLGAASQDAAVIAVRRMMPEGSRLVLTWGDQPGPDYLDADKLILADGTELDYAAAEAAGIDWDEISMAASDIRDTSSPSLTQVDERGMYFSLEND